PEVCSSMRTEMNLAKGRPGSVWMKGSAEDVQNDHLKRRTELFDLPRATVALAKDRLLALMPTLEKHFKIKLNGCQGTKFVIYREGDFYGPHADLSSDPEAPQYARERQVAIVIFLNSEAEEPEPGFYCGGALTFYGLIDDPQWNSFGLPLVGEEGMLAAFSPNLLHEVKPITSGERYSIASWFF
ncbi:MAG: 2OG-Fe(II) oxygenase, partial [Pyrinomonadaceae bacterium]